MRVPSLCYIWRKLHCQTFDFVHFSAENNSAPGRQVTIKGFSMTSFTIGCIHSENSLTFWNCYHVSSFYGAIKFLKSLLDSQSFSQPWSPVSRLFQWENFLQPLAAAVLSAATVDRQNPEPQVDIHLHATYHLFREGNMRIYRPKVQSILMYGSIFLLIMHNRLYSKMLFSLLILFFASVSSHSPLSFF